MRNKILIITVIISLLLLIFFKNSISTKTFTQNSNSISYESKTPKVNSSTSLSKKESKKSDLKIPKINLNMTSKLSSNELDIYQQIIKELNITDEQQRIEKIKKLQNKFFQCQQLQRFDYKFRNSKEIYTIEQKKTYQQSKSNCDELTENNKKLFSILKSPRAINIKQKLLGSEYYNNTMSNRHNFSMEERYEMTSSLIKNFITLKSPYLLERVIMSQQLSQYLQKDKTISELLGSYNIDYIRMINQQALTLLSCEFSNSNTCDKSGLYMLSECFDNQEACGLSLKEWFNYAFTDSHLNDIDTVIDYYVNNSY